MEISVSRKPSPSAGERGPRHERHRLRHEGAELRAVCDHKKLHTATMVAVTASPDPNTKPRARTTPARGEGYRDQSLAPRRSAATPPQTTPPPRTRSREHGQCQRALVSGAPAAAAPARGTRESRSRTNTARTWAQYPPVARRQGRTRNRAHEPPGEWPCREGIRASR